jgi:hypothetical protein
MPEEKALSILQGGVDSGKFDGNIVNALKGYLEKASDEIHETSSNFNYLDVNY